MNHLCAHSQSILGHGPFYFAIDADMNLIKEEILTACAKLLKWLFTVKTFGDKIQRTAAFPTAFVWHFATTSELTVFLKLGFVKLGLFRSCYATSLDVYSFTF